MFISRLLGAKGFLSSGRSVAVGGVRETLKKEVSEIQFSVTFMFYIGIAFKILVKIKLLFLMRICITSSTYISKEVTFFSLRELIVY